ncbi:mobilization protein MobS [Psychrobacter sp. FME5]|uniref:mobilization protein MobS n=1 Tax=Psychrobacter sp. FME5 TaxID=2487706 RepID=UPI00178865B2|nr:mobilization protein MobS [Psychrobacter sp. FME5]MBE0446144.1 mobilization protein MobS [Psychrobacter sp. FME5]
MSLLGGNDLKEQQKINGLELKINREKQKLDKKLTRQKILLGAFLVDALEKDSVQGLKDYIAKTLPEYLTRQTDRELLKGLIENLGGTMAADNNEDKSNIERNI